jgi:hypothetical protein
MEQEDAIDVKMPHAIIIFDRSQKYASNINGVEHVGHS